MQEGPRADNGNRYRSVTSALGTATRSGRGTLVIPDLLLPLPGGWAPDAPTVHRGKVR